MRHSSNRQTLMCLAPALLFALALAFSAVADTTTQPDSKSAREIVNLHAGAKSSLRRLLNVATGVSPTPVKVESRPGNMITGTTPAAGDEIFWDGYELCGDGVIDSATEQCDRSDLGGASCLTEGFMDGVVTCDATCHIDTSQCSGACPVSCAIDADCGVCGPCIPLGAGMGICAF